MIKVDVMGMFLTAGSYICFNPEKRHFIDASKRLFRSCSGFLFPESDANKNIDLSAAYSAEDEVFFRVPSK